MAEAVSITAIARDPEKNKGTGTRVARKLRTRGRIPAIVYGHKQAPEPISLTHDDVWSMVKRGGHLAQLSIDGATQMVILRALQWDHLGKEIIHLDFARVRADERIKTEVGLVLHGIAPGVAEGGLLGQPIHAVTVECLATAIPTAIRIEISELHLNQSIQVRDLVLPEGVTTDADPDQVLVHVTTRAAEVEPDTEPGGEQQPEVIGRKADDKEKDKE
ncbi:MAG: 50S ribosomal protein L25 [Isosphaeraceae bacterium]